jgi:biopolymer transport protein ExbD
MQRPGWRGWAFLALLITLAGADAALYARTLRARERYRQALAAQFALLGRLDPPIAAELPEEQYRPSDAPALQVARNVVAVNADALARLDAVELEPRLRQRLTDVLAKDAARGNVAAERTELLVTIDREVRFRTVRQILRVAHQAGLRRIELLLARSGPPLLSRQSPPEADYLVPSDFVALRAELRATGLSAAPEEPFAVTARRIVQASRATASLPLAITGP